MSQQSGNKVVVDNDDDGDGDDDDDDDDDDDNDDDVVAWNIRSVWASAESVPFSAVYYC